MKERVYLILTILLILGMLHLSSIADRQQEVGFTYSELIRMKTQCESVNKVKCKVGFTMIATPNK